MPTSHISKAGIFFLFVVKLKIIACKLLCLDLFLFLSSTSFFFFFFLVLLYPYNPSLSFSHTNSILHKPLISLSRCHFFFVFKIEECINIAFVFKFRQTSWKCIKQMNYNKRCNYSNIFVNVNSVVIIITIIQCLDTWCGQSCFSKSHDHWQN